MDIATITAGLGSLKTAFELTSAISNLRDETLIKGKVVELQSAILAAQASAMDQHSLTRALMDEIDSVKKKYAELESSIAQLEKYDLKNYGGETFAYEFKGDEKTPPHKICPTCHSNGKKSIIQFKSTNYQNRKFYICNNCNSEIILGLAVENDRPFVAKTDYDIFDRP